MSDRRKSVTCLASVPCSIIRREIVTCTTENGLDAGKRRRLSRASRRGFPKWYGIRRQRDAWYAAELPGCGIESDGATR